MPRGMIRDSCCDYEDVESINNEIRPMLRQLTEMPFFRYYTIQLYKDCPFWVEEMACNNPQCSVYPSEAKTIPSVWRNGRVSAKDASGSYFGMSLNQIKQKLMPKASTSKEFAILEDTESPDAIHVDLIHNPERFTGYAGPSANRIWKSIYEDNCFGLVSGQAAGDAAGWGDQVTRLNGTVDPFSVPPAHKEQLSEFLENLAQARDAATNSTTPGGHALREYWMLYRIVSGLHASISTHLCNEYYDKTTEQWGPNLDCFVSRIGSHPERLENIYFNYAIVLRAVARASKYLRHYDLTGYDSNGHSKHRIGKADSKKTGPVDLQTRQKLHKVLDVTKAVTQTFNETEFFRGREGPKRLEVVKETFRNVSRIMDCVGCEKCRLWGKVQVGGVAAALKILFSYSAKDIASTNTVSISRNEIVALINVFNQFSKSLEAIGRFRTMYQERVSTAIAAAAAAAAASEEKKKKVKTSTTATTPVPPLEQQQSSHSTADEAASSAPHSTVETERQTRPAHDEL
ncbi:endoplasmic reticulum oxidoreductin 1 [Ramicandelaber brevisporus]|nr:endoplasmic reticulum oxidoreductin 1 [Ramicandelaber brevisporus]